MKQQPLAKKKQSQIYFFLPFLLLLVLPLFLLNAQKSQTGQMHAQTNNCSVSDTDYSMDSIEQEFVTILNNYRQQNGLNPVKLSAKLTRAAAWLARDMADKQYMDHTDQLGRDPFIRMNDCGYSGGTAGENIAEGQDTAQEVFTSWKNSPGHNANMLGADYKVIGFASAVNSNGTRYWANDFGGTDDSAAETVPLVGQTTPIAIPTVDVTQFPTGEIPTPSAAVPTAPGPSLITPTLYCLGCGNPSNPGDPVGVQTANQQANITAQKPHLDGKKHGNIGKSEKRHKRNFFEQLLQMLMQLLQKFLGKNVTSDI